MHLFKHPDYRRLEELEAERKYAIKALPANLRAMVEGKASPPMTLAAAIHVLRERSDVTAPPAPRTDPPAPDH